MNGVKRFGKIAVCLLLCAACLIVAVPASAISKNSVTANTIVVPSETAPAPELSAPQTAERMVSYIHQSASSGSLTIGCMEAGTVLKVLGTKGKYYKIDCYDMNGYIAKSQVQVNEAGEHVVTPVKGSGDTAYLPTLSAQEALEMRSQIVELAKKYIGVPYVYGGTGPRGFDCSGYIQYLYKKMGIQLNRTVRNQLSNAVFVAKEDMQPGDLVILSNTGGYGYGSHIGLYIGNGQMIHAGASRGVCIVELDNPYFLKYYQCSLRVILPGVSATASMPTIGTLTSGMGSDWRHS